MKRRIEMISAVKYIYFYCESKSTAVVGINIRMSN